MEDANPPGVVGDEVVVYRIFHSGIGISGSVSGTWLGIDGDDEASLESGRRQADSGSAYARN